MNKLLEIKPNTLQGLLATATPEKAEQFRDKFNSWYKRFRKRRGYSIRRYTSVGQKLPNGYEGMAFRTVKKLRKALLERAGKIFAERNPCTSDKLPVNGEELSFEQLESVTAEVFQELGNRDQTPVQHEMPVEATREKRGAKDARISTGGEGALHSLSCCHGGRQQGSATHHLQRHVVQPAEEGVHRGRGFPWESYQVRAPRGGHVFWCAGE